MRKRLFALLSHTWTNRNNKLNWLSSMDICLKTTYLCLQNLCFFISTWKIEVDCEKFYLIMHKSCLINLSVSLFNETFTLNKMKAWNGSKWPFFLRFLFSRVLLRGKENWYQNFPCHWAKWMTFTRCCLDMMKMILKFNETFLQISEFVPFN